MIQFACEHYVPLCVREEVHRLCPEKFQRLATGNTFESRRHTNGTHQCGVNRQFFGSGTAIRHEETSGCRVNEDLLRRSRTKYLLLLPSRVYIKGSPSASGGDSQFRIS